MVGDKNYKLNKLIEINQTQWEPQELCWGDNITLYLKVNSFPNFNQIQSDSTRAFYLKIKINDISNIR